MSGQKRTWQQVNGSRAGSKKKACMSGPPTQDFTTAEELNKGKPVMEGIQGETDTDSGPARETDLFRQVSGNTLTHLEPPVYDPREGTSAVECTSDDDDDDVSLDSRRLEDPDTVQPDEQPGNINSQTVRPLYTTHLKRQIDLAEVKIKVNKRKLQDMDTETEIKRKTLRKLDLEIQKLEREVKRDSAEEKGAVVNLALSWDLPRVTESNRRWALTFQPLEVADVDPLVSGRLDYHVGDTSGHHHNQEISAGPKVRYAANISAMSEESQANFFDNRCPVKLEGIYHKCSIFETTAKMATGLVFPLSVPLDL
ncbi:nuclease HARBI1 [Labeo rohita]|uniref:Nuclease HARBI1 n=1 Tax=Labeo rohita TaxID=84645 RepID=A0A498L6N8_LABRO|nr:nuclease HARBI1 [Labeo rohita]